ncbi:MAG: ATP-dependent Clp protease adaptor ClpS [Actinomycetaceae bacterium]|nr:ATP-dependent Clp protease adaptor ClpS [Actinomycetaceae bacterium]
MTITQHWKVPNPAKGDGAGFVDAEAGANSWGIIVWNDQVNLAQYVTAAFSDHFGVNLAQARAMTKMISRRGYAVVADGTRERMEAEAQALHEYGVRATVEQLV